MKKAKSKILSALLFALLIVPCMLIVTACGEEHKAVSDWSSNATHHWHACSVKDCKEHEGEKAFNYAEHTGMEDHICDVCGYKEHKATTTYGKDDTKHWFTCQIEGCKEHFGEATHNYDATTHECVCGKVDPAYVAKITTTGEAPTTTYYKSLQEAINDASAGATVTLVKNTSIDSYVTVSGKKLTLDLGGKSLTSAKTGIYATGANTDLTLKNGTINSGATGVFLDNQAKVTVNGDVTIGSNSSKSNKEAGIIILSKATLEMNGKINGFGYGIAGNGGKKGETEDKNEDYGGITITLGSTAEIIASDDALFMPSSGTLTIAEGARLTAGDTALYVKCGNVTINGGTFVTTSEKTPYKPTTSGCYPTGAAVVIDTVNGDSYIGGNPTVTINGGTFTVAQVEDGKTPANAIEYYHLADETYSATISYGDKVTARAVEYVYTPAGDGTEAKVTPVVTYVSTFAELTSAIADANVKTVVLTEDITANTTSSGEDGHVTVSRKVTLDLNGKTLKGSGYWGVLHIVGGDLTVEGSKDGSAVVANGAWGEITGGNGYRAMAVYAYGGKVTINGGHFSNTIPETSRRAYNDLIYAKNNTDNNQKVGAEIIINGGTFESVTSGWVLNISDGSKSGETSSTITVYGGKFKKFNPETNKGFDTLESGEEEGKVNRTGGQSDGSFVATDYKVVKEIKDNVDWYTVVEKTAEEKAKEG